MCASVFALFGRAATGRTLEVRPYVALPGSHACNAYSLTTPNTATTLRAPAPAVETAGNKSTKSAFADYRIAREGGLRVAVARDFSRRAIRATEVSLWY